MQFNFLQIPVASAYGHKGSKAGLEAWPDGLTAWAYDVGFNTDDPEEEYPEVEYPEVDDPKVDDSKVDDPKDTTSEEEDDPATGGTTVGINSGAFTHSSATRFSLFLWWIK